MSKNNMASEYEMVVEFNRLIIGVEDRSPEELEVKTFNLLMTQLREEVQEFSDAHSSRDFIAQVDSLIDLVYFAFGGLYKMGVSPDKFHRIFSAVHSANMMKKAGIKKERGDHGATDAYKPAEWVDPSLLIARILSED